MIEQLFHDLVEGSFREAKLHLCLEVVSRCKFDLQFVAVVSSLCDSTLELSLFLGSDDYMEEVPHSLDH